MGWLIIMPVDLDHKLDLWSLVLDSISIDPTDLLQAIEAEAGRADHDFRTRLLLRDSYFALKNKWGVERLRMRLSPTAAAAIDRLLTEDLGEKGFSSLENRLMEHTRPETIERFLRELGSSVRESCSLHIGGSCGLILLGLLHCRTDDVDTVNEVPAPIRKNHELMERLITRYGLRLAHFQSHYLPDNWESRLKSFGVFGPLQVFLVDPVDIALGKLFSRREKDLDDVRSLLPAIGKLALKERLESSGKSLRSDPTLCQNAKRNWYILFGDSLPG